MTDSLDAALLRSFGYPAFRPGQRAIVEAALDGRDILAVMPTGGGKSLTFQLPALLGAGVTIVISPLIALMKDQVDRLAARQPGAATFLNSTVRSEQAQKRLAAAIAGTVRLLYVAPERLRSTAFRGAMADAQIDRIVVDEAHCVSEWGHDFRPEYLAIAAFADTVGRPPILALTATATPNVRADIQRQLGLNGPAVIVAPLDRPNLRFSVQVIPRKNEKTAAIVSLVRQIDGSGIVYAGTRRDAEDVASALARAGESATLYHAGLTNRERTAAQEAFLSGEKRVVVATNAFGLGIDKPDVRFVIHFGMPATPEAYFQEAGRAGRDGKPSRCILLFAPVDIGIQRFLVQRDVPDERAMLDVLARIKKKGQRRVHVDPEEIAGDLGVSELLVRLSIAGLERGGALERGPDEYGMMTFERVLDAPAPRLWAPVTIDAERRRRRRMKLLWRMADYARAATCRRVWQLRYFGEYAPPPAIDSCCDICDPVSEPVVERAVARGDAAPRKVAFALDEDDRELAVLQLVAALAGGFGRQGVGAMLRGRTPKGAESLGVEGLPGYGALGGLREVDVHSLIDGLVAAGLLDKDKTARPRLRLTPAGKDRVVASEPPPVETGRLRMIEEARSPFPMDGADRERIAAVAREPVAADLTTLVAALDDPDLRIREMARAGLRRLALLAAVPPGARREARAALVRMA